MQFALSCRLCFAGIGRYRLRQFPKRRPSGESVVGIVVHQQFPHAFVLGFQQAAFLHEPFQFLCEVDLLGSRSLYFERFATDVVAAEELGRKVVHRRHGGLRIEFVRPLRELDIIGQLTAQMDLLHYVLTHHTVQADAVEQEDADVHRPVAEIRRELQRKAWQSIGPIRRADEISDFLLYIESIKKEKLKAETPQERLLALEMPGLTASAEAVAKAALARKESVGAHYIV